MSGWTCAACGGENPPNTRFCGHCGTPRAGEPDVSETLRSFVAGQVADRLIEQGGTLPEERRLVTALFADVSGFTSLAERLDPEQLLEVIDPIIGALSSIVGRYEGYVEKFAGDALLALFGAPVSHEDDPERALRVALEMHEDLARICAGLPEENRDLTLHVGVNSGHGVARILGSSARMDYAVLGDSVILAQRLESAAPAGETYVSETTYRLARHRFELEPVGELTLKGKAEPVRAWRLLGERAVTDAGRRGRLVGRDRELAVVSHFLDDLAAGRGGVLAVSGEAGVGKTRLTEEARARAEAADVGWLQTRCISYGAALPYWPYVELLRTAGRTKNPYFARLLGEAQDAEVAALEPEAFRRRLHEAFAEWLARLSAERPTLLAIEDAHWADASSAELTAELTALGTNAPFGLYLASRPQGTPILVEATEIELARLSVEQVEDLVAALLGETSSRLPAFVHERTDGNPFFVEELLRSLQEAGALAAEDGRWKLVGDVASDVPQTIEGVLAARIDLLPRPAAAALQTASVIGRRIPVPLLELVVADDPDLAGSLDRLVSAGFLEPVDEDGERRLAFHHALMQDVAYSRLLRRRRRELHLQVAEIAEQLYGSAEDAIELLARHLYLGQAGAKAVDYLVRAGGRARALYANEEALVHLRRALELAPDRTDVALELAGVLELVGDYEEAMRLYSQAREATGDIRGWRGAAATLRKQGRYEEALALIEAAPADPTLDLERAWTLTVSGRFEDAIAVVAEALAAAPGRRDECTGLLLLQLARAETMTGRADEALEHALAARPILQEEADLGGLVTALRIAGNAYVSLGRLDDAAVALRDGLELAERVGNVEEIGGCLIGLGQVELERGNVDQAIACDRRAIDEFERIGHGAGRALSYGNLAEKLMVAGAHDEALALCGQALEVADAIGHTPTIADVHRTAARILLRQGRRDEALVRAEQSAAAFRAMGAEDEADAALALV